MKAIVYDEFGPPDILRLADVDPPTPKAHEILLKVHAASVNPLDWHFIRGEPAVMRLSGKPKAKIPGADVAGTVEAVGSDVRRFRRGDEVLGSVSGAFAEYACGHEDRFALKPHRVSFEHGAAIPVAGVTALRALRNYGRLKPGQSVLVNGASGGVGTFALQIAKASGARVTAVCSTAKVDLARSIGADRVIDYTREDFAAGAQRYDLILDIGGSSTLARLRRVLAENGTLVIVGGEGGDRWFGGMDRQIRAMLLSMFSKQKMCTFISTQSTADLLALRELIEARTLAPVVDTTYPLAQAAAAIRHLAEGRARGKVVITIP